jgi:solute:Na+ symporter, SSS family
MPEQIPLNNFDLSVFIVYMVVTVALGFWVAGKNRKTARGYFLGDKKLPWYVVATSMIAADISSDDLIANAGVAYKYGIMPAAGSWNAWIIYTLLIWIFLPYYVRSGIYTMPQFLEKRYNSTCRYIFAVALVIGYVAAILGGTLYAGGLALQGMLNVDLTWAIIFFGVTTGAYTIYGGLISAAWTDFAQVALLLTAGVLIPVLGLMHPDVGGLANLMHEQPQRFQVYLPPTHERFPVTGVFTGFLTVGIWYSCTSQHMVQRVLGAKDEWHARMGVVGAGYLRIITPFFFVLPGIIAYKLFPKLERPDMAYLSLVKELIPTGLRGLILAGMAAALMSNVSSVLNSASTLVTMDLYKKLRESLASGRAPLEAGPRPGKVLEYAPADVAAKDDGSAGTVPERDLVRVGRISGVVILIVSMLIGYYYSQQKESLYEQLQRIFFFIAPPFAVIFLVGLLWRRATAAAAVWTIGLGFAFTGFLVFYAFRYIEWLQPYKTYQHPAFIAWLFCMIVMIVVSLLTKEPPPEKVDGVIWDRHYAKLPLELRQRYHGWRDYRIWWAGFVGSILAIYGFFLWWRFHYPASATSVW